MKPKYAGLVIANLAKKIKLNYREISPEPTKYSNNNQQGLISIPINLLEKKLVNDIKYFFGEVAQLVRAQDS